MFTDAEVLMSISHDRAIRQTVSQAQGLVDRKNAEISMLTIALQAARRDLELERARSMRLELELDAANRLLDTEI